MKKRFNISALLIVAILLLVNFICRRNCKAETAALDVSPTASHENLEERDIVIVQFVSASVVGTYMRNFHENEKHLFLHLNKAALLICSPISDVLDVQRHLITALNWTHVASYSHIHQYTNGTIEEYVSPRGIRILFQAMHVDLPPKVLQNHHIKPSCAGRTFQISYALYSGAVFSHHILQLPIIDKFKVFVKVDADLTFTQDVSFDIGQKMISQGCSVMHSVLEAVWSGCEDGNLEAIRTFAASTGAQQPLSDSYEWCNKDMQGESTSFIIYGNFMGYSRDLIQRIRPLASWLYYEWQMGYFVKRWGDQGASIAFVCYALDIPDITNDQKVCDFSKLRSTEFIHAG